MNTDPLKNALKKLALAMDAERWITVKPNSPENKGRPALIDSETGTVKAGMGGKFNGRNIDDIPRGNSPRPVSEKKHQARQERVNQKENASEKATNARFVENMNAAQLEQEIKRKQDAILKSQEKMNKNGESEQMRAKREAFPLGVGASGWSESRRRQHEKLLKNDLERANQFSLAYQEKQRLEAELNTLQKARQDVGETGKTQNQLKQEKEEPLKKSNSTRKWTQTAKESRENSSYTPKKISSGDYDITGRSGFYRVFYKGQLIGNTDNLNKAKNFVDLYEKKIGAVKSTDSIMSQDHFAIDRAATARHIDENGYLHVDASHITRVQVAPYYGHEIPGWQEAGLEPDKIYYGFRAPEELQKSLPTWAGIPLHIEHHIDSADDPQKLTRVGTVGTDIVWNPPYIDAPLSVWDQKAIDAIEDGSFRELSCAYRYDPDFTFGEHEGQHYDFIMRNIRGNHVALVQEGRAGKDVLVADGAITLPDNQPIKKEVDMGKMNWFRGAKDADPEIEQKEVDLAQAIIDLHRVDPKTGEVMDMDDDVEKIAALKAVIESVKDKLSPDEMQRLTDAVTAMCVRPEGLNEEAKEDAEGKLPLITDEGEGVNPEGTPADPEVKKEGEDEEPTAPVESVKGEDEEAEEDKPICDKDPLEIITAILPDLTDEQKEKLQAAFATIADDEECEKGAADESAEEQKMEAAQDKALKRRSVRKGFGAMDAATIKAQAASEAMQTMRDLADATRRVRPLVGDMDPFAFDSAANVYGYTLEQMGYNPTKYNRSAWRGMVDAIIAERNRADIELKSPFAKDSKSIPTTGHFAGLANINLGE